MCLTWLTLTFHDASLSNIALLQTYGPNAWRVHNYLLEATSKGLDKALEELKERTTEVNRERKQFQVS